MVTNGVPQGSVYSPTLFDVYADATLVLIPSDKWN